MSTTDATTTESGAATTHGTTVVDVDPVAPVRTEAHVVVDGITPEAADELRRHVEEASGGGNRFVWFITGFVAALVAGAVASLVFLAVSDDDDGEIDIEVPTVDLSVDG